MPALTLSREYLNLLSTTLDHYLGDVPFTDQVFQTSEVLNWFNKNAKKIAGGGATITGTVLYADNTTTAQAEGFTAVGTNDVEQFTRYLFTPTEYKTSVVISKADMLKNRGEEQLSKLLEDKLAVAKLSIANAVNNDLIDGTGNMVSLSEIVATTGTVGSLAPADVAQWASQTATASDFNGTSAATNGLLNMRTLHTACMFGNERPDVIFADESGFNVYEQIASANERPIYDVTTALASNGKVKKMIDAGFFGWSYRGIPVYFDRAMTANKMYFVNSNHTFLEVYRGADFDKTPFEDATILGKTAAVCLFHWMGQLITRARRLNGILNDTNT